MKQSNNQTLVKIPFSGFYNSIENEKVAKASYYKKSKLARMNKANLYELLEKHNRNICNIEHITKLDMIDCLLEIDNQEYYSKH